MTAAEPWANCGFNANRFWSESAFGEELNHVRSCIKITLSTTRGANPEEFTSMRKISCGALTGLFMVLSAVALSAKGQTVKLTITGPSLASPVEITSGKALEANVWSDTGFFAGPASEPPATLPRYVISFYVEPPRNPVRLMYVVTYAYDPTTEEGFVYLPGRGEEGYRLNVSTILRDGKDGKWHHADPQWSRAIVSALAH